MTSTWLGPEGSFLSASNHGYDFVVAATEFGLNDAVKRHLISPEANTTAPAIELFTYEEERLIGGVSIYTPIILTMDQVYAYQDSFGKSRFNPFDVADNTTLANEPDLSNLDFDDDDAEIWLSFEGGFRARLGIPGADDYESSALDTLIDETPNILMLDAINDIKLNLLCSEFQVVELKRNNRNPNRNTMRSWTQPKDDPWIFTSSVDINFEGVAFDRLPQAVQDQMMVISGETFSIQQLLFDITQSALTKRPTLPQDLDPVLQLQIEGLFVAKYWDIFLANGGPILGYAGKADPDAEWEGSLKVDDYKLSVSLYHNETGSLVQTNETRRFNTLNYLCMATNQTFPTINTMEWNYANTSANPKQGIVATNRDVFAGMARDALIDHAASNCYNPVPSTESVGSDEIDFVYVLRWAKKDRSDPIITKPNGTSTLLTFSHASDEDVTVLYFYSSFPRAKVITNLQYNYSMEVSTEGKTIKVHQHIIVDAHYRAEKILTGNQIFDQDVRHIDRETLTTFTLQVNSNGTINSTFVNDGVDYNDEGELDISGFQDYYGDMRQFSDDIQTKAEEIVETHFEFQPEGFLSTIKSFVLPAGKGTFKYTDVQFSDHGDLLATWTYR